MSDCGMLFLTDREDRVIESNVHRRWVRGTLPGNSGSPNHYTSRANTMSSTGRKGLVVEIGARTLRCLGLLDGGCVRIFLAGYGLCPGSGCAGDSSGRGSGGYLVAYDGPNPNVGSCDPGRVFAELLPLQQVSVLGKPVVSGYGNVLGLFPGEATGDIAQAIDELWRL